jgi:hypothetical protein
VATPNPEIRAGEINVFARRCHQVSLAAVALVRPIKWVALIEFLNRDDSDDLTYHSTACGD